MSNEPKQPQRVPTLTEVIGDMPAANAPAPALPTRKDADLVSDPLLATALMQEARVAERVIERLQPRIDVLFEHRLRESLAPALARLYASFADAARKDLARVLRETVEQVVNEEMARHRAP
jgi:hypothetical protein